MRTLWNTVLKSIYKNDGFNIDEKCESSEKSTPYITYIWHDIKGDITAPVQNYLITFIKIGLAIVSISLLNCVGVVYIICGTCIDMRHLSWLRVNWIMCKLEVTFEYNCINSGLYGMCSKLQRVVRFIKLIEIVSIIKCEQSLHLQYLPTYSKDHLKTLT